MEAEPLPWPLPAGEAKSLPLPLTTGDAEPLPLPLAAGEVEPLSLPLSAGEAEPLPLPLPAVEAEPWAWGVERRVSVFLVLLALGVEPGPGDVPKRSGRHVVQRVVRRLRSTTAVAAGDPFCCTLAGAFVLVLRPGMLEDVSQEKGRNAEEPEKTDQARERDDRHGGGSSGSCGGEWFCRRGEDCFVAQGILHRKGMANGQIWEQLQVVNSACERSAKKSEILGTRQGGGGTAAAVANCHTGSLKNCGWLKTSRTTTDTHNQKNVSGDHDARMRVKQEKWRQRWRVAFSEQKDRQIRCRASMRCDDRT